MESQTLGYILAVFLIFMWACPALYNYTRPENVKERRNRREKDRIARQENERTVREKREHERQQQELKRLQRKEEELAQYRQLRKEIETMPQYEHWRQSVFEKFGRKCAVCAETENLEVDHRYMSFYLILKTYRITNTIQAYGCAQLWNIDNGAPLCKSHHDQTPSSRKYQEQSFPQIV